MTNDRHRHVINQRLKEIQEKNVLQEFPQLSELFNYVMDGSLNIDQILQLPQFTHFKFEVPSDVQ